MYFSQLDPNFSFISSINIFFLLLIWNPMCSFTKFLLSIKSNDWSSFSAFLRCNLVKQVSFSKVSSKYRIKLKRCSFIYLKSIFTSIKVLTTAKSETKSRLISFNNTFIRSKGTESGSLKLSFKITFMLGVAFIICCL